MKDPAARGFRRRAPGEAAALFGHPRRLAVLLEISRGPLHVRDLARRTDMDAHRAWDIVEHFIACGVVAKREYRTSRRIVRLDPAGRYQSF